MKGLLTVLILTACLLITVTAACARDMQRYDGVGTESPYWEPPRRVHHRHHRHADYHRYCCKRGQAYYKADRNYGYERQHYVYEDIYYEPFRARRFWDELDRSGY